MVGDHRKIRTMKTPLSLIRHYSFVIAFLSLGGILSLSGCTTFNEATGRHEFIFISTDEEVAMGRTIHEQITKEFRLSFQRERAAKLQRIGQHLAQVSDRQDYEYHFYLIDKDELNAFTTPGGNIYFFSGLLDKLTDDDEIAAVLAHEIGHSAAKHTVKKFQAALGYNLIGSIVLSQIAKEDIRDITSLSSDALMSLVFSSYSRRDEYEADRLGVKYMFLAGYNLNGMIRTLELLKRESKGPDVPLILKTHPHLDDRIQAVRQEIELVLAKEKNAPAAW
jgi:predicted Zn-dependent protease